MLTQSFLPLMTADNRTLGIVPITTTTYPDTLVTETLDTITSYGARGNVRNVKTHTAVHIGPATNTTKGSITQVDAKGRVLNTKPRVVTTYPLDGITFNRKARSSLGTQTINGVTYRLRTVNYHQLTGETWQRGNAMTFVAIDLSHKEERNLFQNNLRMLNLIAFDNQWIQAPNTTFKITYVGQLAAFYAQAAQVQATNPILSTPTGNNFSRNWSANSPFTNIGSSQFIDINWQQELQINATTFQPTSASLGTATSDPGSGRSLRAFLVQSPTIVGNLVVNSTVRIVKVVQGSIAVGTYTWPLTATDSQGNTATFNLSIVVS